MILELLKNLSKVDSSLDLSMNYSSDGVYTFSVGDERVRMYSFSSTDVTECYNKIVEFMECLEDTDKFFDLIRRIEEEPLGV